EKHFHYGSERGAFGRRFRLACFAPDPRARSSRLGRAGPKCLSVKNDSHIMESDPSLLKASPASSRGEGPSVEFSCFSAANLPLNPPARAQRLPGVAPAK